MSSSTYTSDAPPSDTVSMEVTNSTSTIAGEINDVDWLKVERRQRSRLKTLSSSNSNIPVTTVRFQIFQDVLINPCQSLAFRYTYILFMPCT